MTIWNRLATRLRADERGAIAVWFALSLVPIMVLAFGLVDISRITVQKRQLQDALDAATLIAARSTSITSDQLQTVGAAAMTAELADLGLNLAPGSPSFSLDGNVITGSASAVVPLTISNLWTSGSGSTIAAHTEVVRASKNLEVALVLDTTGSMAGSRIADLKTGAAELVDLVVRDVQTPYYSKVAIVPYSAGVNLDTYADQARGPVRSATISGAAWEKQAAVNISGVTKANPAVVTTSSAHGLAAGDTVYIKGVVGMTTLNNKVFTVGTVSSTTKFTLSNIDSSSYSKWTSGGTVTRCRTTTCSVVVTTKTTNDFTTGDLISFSGVGGMTQLNGKTTTGISVIDTTSFDTKLVGTSYTAYTSGGTATCTTSTTPGCQNLAFTTSSGGSQTWGLTKCGTERTGAYAYTDDAPSTAYVGRNYSTNGGCPTSAAAIAPLSSDKTALKAKITSLAASGSTSGQIGLAWGWYMVSPNFNELWPSTSQNAAGYGGKELLKVVILMTDGAFNTAYCKGVVSKDFNNGSTSINCNATNGDPFTQAATLCENIRAKGIILYTVGFDVGDDAKATAMLRACATDPDHARFPATGEDLKSAFRSLGQEISSLRIAK
ncbi:ubiquitin-activating E1 FCCH domain-containing protein [Caulobacter sp. LARHSG274]